MSAFLGPIHQWLFNKIKYQYNIVTQLWDLGSKYGLTLEAECKQQFGTFPDQDLEEIIDPYNIHGWLQEHVSLVENQYAYSVLSLLKRETTAEVDSIFHEICTILKENGKTIGSSYKEDNLSAPQVFKVISDILLDGMPCDHANQMVSQSPEEVIWKRNICVHENYWTDLGGNVATYYNLRDAWFEGFLQELSYTLVKLDDVTYKVRTL